MADPAWGCCRGFTLVEALVALVVLSVGLLGIAGLHLEGLRAGRAALYRTSAVTLAADMADRIRANRTAGAAYAGEGPGADGGCVNGADDCTPGQLAADDWFRWRADVEGRLPPGAGALIEVAPAGPDATAYTITLRWPEIGQAEPASYALRVET